jgi:hypothetical protein
MKSKQSVPQSQFRDLGSAVSRRIAINSYRVAGSVSEFPSSPTPRGGSQEADRLHPCLTRNNSITLIDKGIPMPSDEDKDSEYNHYKEKIEPTLGSLQFKQQKRMEHIINHACLKFGRDSIATLDLTFENDADGNQPSFDYVNGCINSLRTNVLSKRYGHEENGKHYNDFFVVCEKGGKRGRLHFHILFAKVGADFRTGSILRKCNGRKKFVANADCRTEFNYFRGILERYGFGAYVRIQPLWDVSKGAKYFTKYVGKGHYGRDEDTKGRQLVRYGNGFDRWHSMKFSNIGGAARDRRHVLESLGRRYQCADLGELNETFGSKWQYYAGDQMRFACAMTRRRPLPFKTISWLKGYLWNMGKLQLILQKRGEYRYEIMGAYKYMLKESVCKARLQNRQPLIGQSFDDDDYERTGLMVANNMRQYAYENLCSKLESDWADQHPSEQKNFLPLPPVEALHKMKPDTKQNETKQYESNKSIAGHCEHGTNNNGQSEIDWDIY